MILAGALRIARSPAARFLATLLNNSTVSAPLSMMISRARRSRADLDKIPEPETRQILSRL
jgi:hypothetical protein